MFSHHRQDHGSQSLPSRRSRSVRATIRSLLSCLGVVLIFCGLSGIANAAPYPANTIFYIGTSGCNNSGSGTTTSAPWCDFTNVNGKTFSQGDQILLQSGSYFTGQMSPLGNGASGNPITVGCYGSSCSANYPVINPGTSSAAVSLTNPSYWTVSNLTLTGGLYGVYVNFTQLGNQGLVFQNLYVYNLAGNAANNEGNSPAIFFTGLNSNPPQAIPSGQYIINNVLFSNIGISKAGAISLTAGYANAQQVNNGYPNAQQNIVIKNISADSFYSCFEIANVQNLIMMDSSLTNGDPDGSCGTSVYIEAVTNVTFDNILSANDKFTNQSDNAAFVFDNQIQNLIWRGNYFANNATSGVEGSQTYCFSGCTSSTESGVAVADSTFYNNSTANNGNFYGDIALAYSPVTPITVTQSLYSDTPQTYNGFIVGGGSGYQTQSGNINFGTSSMFNSAAQFSSTQNSSQWQYAYWNGSAWFAYTPTYNSTSKAWLFASGAYINQFDIQPDTCTNCWVARYWTAPKSGTVHVRGWVLKNTTGTPAQVAIYHGGMSSGFVWGSNGSWYTLAANDQTGVEAAVDVTVSQGDTLQFLTGNQSGGDPTKAIVSWMPTIVYQ